MNAHPHFDLNLVIWDDRYSGQFAPLADYDNQFDLQWKLAQEGAAAYQQHPGADISDTYIDDRIYEWTGIHPKGGGLRDSSAGSRKLDHSIDPNLIKDKRCLDLCCGMGRWTRVMQRLGARSVLSVDASPNAINSVTRFNANVRQIDLFALPKDHPDMLGAFDFVCFWGVAMCTHDPKLAFEIAASTVAPGGWLYLMVYADGGLHSWRSTQAQRKRFHSLGSQEERLDYVKKVSSLAWGNDYSLLDNIRNALFRLAGRPGFHLLGILDMLSPSYNWVIPYRTAHNWFRCQGFDPVIHLNCRQFRPCAYHILGKKVSATP